MELKRDLSEYHHLIGELFPNISAKEAWNTYKLSNEEVTFFNENGFLHNVKILEQEQVDALNKELLELMNTSNPKHDLFYEFHTNESADPSSVLFHSLGHWRITKGFHDALWNPRFLVAACQLLGGKSVRFWHDQLFCKPAHHGGVVAWHQDYSYWTETKPIQHLTCWIGLDDANKDNGCLYYIPKSHKWDLLENPNLAGDMDGLMEFLTEDQKEMFENKVAIEMPKGYAAFHHPLTVHGSYENNSSNSRRAMVINVFEDGTISDIDAELLVGVPPISKGNKMEGQFYPLLFDPKDL